MLETKWTKSSGKSQFSRSFLSSTVNDIRRKLLYGRNTLDCRKNEQKECQILQSRLLSWLFFENVKFNSRFVVVVDDCPVTSFDSWQLKYFDGRFGLEASVRSACF